MKESPDIELPEFLGPRDRHHVPSRSLGLAPTSPETSIRHALTSVRLLTRFRWTILLAVAISLLAALLPGGYAEAQTAPSIQRVAITSDPGEDGGYGLDDEIEVGLTFSEGVSVFVGGINPQITLDVGGGQRKASYSGVGTSTRQMLFTYAVAEGDEDTDGIAVVANSLMLNGGTIESTQDHLDASLIHPALQADGHLVDGIAPTVRVGGVNTAFVSPERSFNVFFNFSEPVYGITDDEVVVTNGSASSTNRVAGTDEHPENTRWVAVVQPAGEGPVSVYLKAGAATDVFGNGNATSSGALSVIAADPVTVEVLQRTSDLDEGDKAEFALTRSRDSGTTTVSLSVEQSGDFMSGTVEISRSSGTTTALALTFNGATSTMEVTFEAGETGKTISFPTDDDAVDEPSGTIKLSVPANPEQYKYIPGSMSSAVSQVRDNDEPESILLSSDSYSPLSPLQEGNLARYLLRHGRYSYSSVSAVYLEFTEGLELLDLDGAGFSGYVDEGDGRIRVQLRTGYVTRFSVPTLENDTFGPGGRITLAGRPGDGYVFNEHWTDWTYRLNDDDSPPNVTLAAPEQVTEGDEVRYTITRTSHASQSRAELTVNVQLEQTGDYISWPEGNQPDDAGRVSIPVVFPAGGRITTLSLATVDDEVIEADGLVSALVLPALEGRYTVGTSTPQTTVLRDNEPPQISLAPVNAEVAEGSDAQFNFTRLGDNNGTTTIGLYVTGHGKMMTVDTKAIAATSDRTVDPLSINGARVDYILEFGAGEAQKVLALTTRGDNVNEGDGLITVSVLPGNANSYRIIGPRRADVLVKDDDVPTVSILMPTVPPGVILSESGDTWEGSIEEGLPISFRLQCTGEYEFNAFPHRLTIQTDWFHEMNHPAQYGGAHSFGSAILGYNAVGTSQIQNCGERDVNSPEDVGRRYVGPDGGELRIELAPANTQPADRHQALTDAYAAAVEEALRTGIPITQTGLFPNTSYRLGFLCRETRFCPRFDIGTPSAIRITVVNRDPTILISAESTVVEEGQPARFIVERRWNDDLLLNPAPDSETVVALRVSQNGRYITGALPTEITFGQYATSTVVELETVDDGAYGDNGSVTIELLPDTTGTDLNTFGKYSIHEYWLGHTPPGARSDRATVAITNDDTAAGISIAAASAIEGDAGATSTSVTFNVFLTRVVSTPVQVEWATSDGTAIAGRDYTAATSSVTIPHGATSTTFAVTLTGDDDDEPDETFNVTISMPEQEPGLFGGGIQDPPEAAIIGGDTAAATGTIIDDDPATVTITTRTPEVEEGEVAVFTLTRSGVTSEEMEVSFMLRGSGRQEVLNATFEPESITTMASHTTVDDALVNYPPERDYEAVLMGDSFGSGNLEDTVWTPGDPASATVTVTDNDELVIVTVHPESELAREGEEIWAIFRRTGGDISQPLAIQYRRFVQKNQAQTDFFPFQHIEFPAGQAEVRANPGAGILPNDDVVNNPNPGSGSLYLPWTMTTVIYGDGGPNGLHRIWRAGIPNTATTVLYDDDKRAGLELHARYSSHRAAIGDQVSIEFTVINTGTATSGFPIRITSVQRDDGNESMDGQAESRVGCTIAGEIKPGESGSCTATFTVGQADFDSTPLELDATATFTSTDGKVVKSKPFRIYIKILDGIVVGFKETSTLELTEGEDSTADLVVIREGFLKEEVQVAYITRPFEGNWDSDTATEGEDYADRSVPPGVVTFMKNLTEATISFDIIADELWEKRERFEVILQPPDGVKMPAASSTRLVLIKDNRGGVVNYRPRATLHLTEDGTVTEDSGSVEFAVRLNYASVEPLRYLVSLDSDAGTAAPGVDFVDPGTITVALAPGQKEATFTVALIDDDEAEDPETFRLSITHYSHVNNWPPLGTTREATVTIVDDDRVEPSEVRLTLTFMGRTFERVNEQANRRDITVTASFHADTPVGTSRTLDPLDEDTTVRVRFDPASTADLTDFRAFDDLEVVIPAGQASGTSTLRFKPESDGIDEDDETVTLGGSVVATSSVDDSLPVVPSSFTIADDDTRGITVVPALLLSMQLVENGDSKTYTVVLDSQPTDTVTIEIQFDESGQLNISPTTLTFTSNDWNTPQKVTVWAEDDGIIRVVNEDSFEHEVSGGDYDQVELAGVQVSIEDTTVPYIYVGNARALESSGYVEFTVRVRPPLPTTPINVRYSTADGTATAGSDYTREVDSGKTDRNLHILAGRSIATIRIPISNDTLDEADVETFTLRLASSTKAKLAGDVRVLTATGSIVDDDPAPVVTISGPDGSLSHISEDVKTPVTFTLTLSGGSSEDATVDYATGLARGLSGIRTVLSRAKEGEDYTAATGTVTFRPGEKTKTITVELKNDEISESIEYFGLNLRSPRNAEFNNRQSEEGASVGILDDDPRGVIISPSRIMLEEPRQGATSTAGSYTVVLKSQPTATTTVAIGGATDPAVDLVRTSLTFTPIDWDTPQTVSITPVRDADAVSEFITVTHTLTGGDYGGLRAGSVLVRVDDSDTRDLIVSVSRLTISEGHDDTYTVKLASQPTATTTVSVIVAGAAQLTTDPTGLTFTTSNWNTPQTITVTATQDDDTFDNTATVTNVASGSDYVSVTRTVRVTVTDGDRPDVRITPVRMSLVEGSYDYYMVSLLTKPTGPVTISINPVGDVETNKTSLSFDQANWHRPQSVRVSAQEDDDGFGGTATVTHTASGGDYGSVRIPSVNVDMTDDDPRGVTVSTTTLAITEGSSGTYTINLDTQPTATTTLTVNAEGEGDLTAVGPNSTSTLTFTTFNWSAPQTVTVTAGHDNDLADHMAILDHEISGGDYNSGGEGSPDSVNVPNVNVTVVDDDTPELVLSTSTLPVVEGDPVGASYTVSLSHEPAETVTVEITGHSGTDLGLSKTTLSFATSTWNIAQTVTVTADDDSNAVDEEVTLTHTASGGEYGGVAADLAVTVTDDAPESVEVSFESGTYTVMEGSTVTVTVMLSEDPERTITIDLVGAGEGGASTTDFTLHPARVTFNSGEVSKTVVFTATQDSDDDDDESVRLTFGTLPPVVSGGTTTAATVDIVDDDDPMVRVNFESDSYSVSEGSTTTVSVVLSADPEREVTIDLLKTNVGGATDSDYSGMLESLIFESGDTKKSFTLTAVDDTVDDDGESVRLTFGTLPDRVTEGETTETTISIDDDDDPMVRVSFESDSYSVSEGSTTTVSVVLSADPEREVTIDLLKTNVGGATDSDYSGVPESLIFDRGVAERSFVVTAAGDLISDGGESVELTFGVQLPPRVELGATSTSSVRIIDVSSQGGTPPLQVSFGHSGYPVPEGATDQVSVRLSAAPGSDVTIPITKTEMGGATTTDYSGVPDVVTFGATDTEKRFVFTATQDTDDDDGESVELGFGVLPGGLRPGTIATTSVAIVDDDAPESVEVSFESDTYTVDEGSAISIQVILSEDPERRVVIPITRAGRGGATSTDYSGVPDVMTFNPRETSKTIVFTAEQDGIDDSGESVRLTFGELPDRVSRGSVSTATVSINDDDTAGVTVSTTTLEIDEGATDTYTAVLDTEPTGDVTVAITGHSGTDITLSGDTLTNGALTFTSDNWNTAQTVTVTAAQDDDAASDAAVTLTHTVTGAGEYSGVTAGRVTVTIVEKDISVLSVDDARAAEDGGHVVFTVSISAANGEAVTVDYATSNGTATAGQDYTHASGTLTFPANLVASQTVSVPVIEDTADEAEEETFTLTLSNVQGASLAGGGSTLAATGTITDNDDPTVTASFAQTDYSVNEGGTVEVTVSLSKDPEREVTIQLTHEPQGGATSTDYSGVPDGLTFVANDTAKSFTFRAAGDDIDDDGESVALTFRTPMPAGVTAGATATATVSINDDDTAGVTVSTTTLEIDEGATDTYTAVLDTEPTGDVTVAITGHSGTDITLSGDTLTNGALTFTSDNWNTAQTVTVTAAQDDDAASDAAVTLTHTVTGAGEYSGVTAGRVTVTIVEKDISVLSVDDARAAEDGGHVVFTVSISAANGEAVTVDYATSNGTATAGQDYTHASGTLTFPANLVASQTVSVPVIEDTADEAEEETFTLTLSNVQGASLAGGGSTLAATGTITDNDDPTVTASFAQTDYSVNEGGTVEVTVSLSKDPEREVTIQLTHEPQGGATSTDYSGVPDGLTFVANDTAKSFTFRAAGDDIDDDGESVALTFRTPMPAGVTAGATATATVSINDDDTAGVTVSTTTLEIDEGATDTYTAVLDTEPTGDVTVAITGHSGTDITLSGDTLTNGALTFTSDNWNTAQTVTVTAAQDDDAASDAAVTLTHTVTGAGEYSGVTAGRVTVTIVEKDISVLSVDDARAAEDGGHVVFTVSISAANGEAVTVDYATSNGTATAGQDYTHASGTLTFPANLVASQTVSVPVIEDTADEAEEETFTLTLSNVQGASLAGGGSTLAATGTITDNDDPTVTASFAQTDYSVNEGGTVEVTVSLSKDPEREVTIQLTHEPQGGATSTDYSGVPDGLTFVANDTAKSFTFRAAGDDIDDDGESVALTFRTPMPAGVTAGATATATVSINDDDTAGVTVSTTTLEIDEGATATYTAVLDTEPTAGVTVAIAGHSGTDITVSGDTLTNGALTFTSTNWETAQTVTVTAAQDDDATSDAAVTLTHTANGGDYVDVKETVTVTIVEKDTSVLSVGDARAAEDGGHVVFTVSISAASGATTTVDYATSDVTAAAGQDYTHATGTLTFSPNSVTSRTVSVPITDDTIDEEEEETFTLTLSNVRGASLAGGGSTMEAIGTITDNDDPTVTASFGQTAYSVNEGGTVEVTVTLSKDPEREVTIQLTHEPQGGATSTDYSGVPASLVFQSGETEKSFTFRAAGDDIDDDGESVALTFRTPMPAGVTAGATATVSINDDDNAGVTVSTTTLEIDEGATATYTVVLDTEPTAGVTVAIAGHSGTDITVSGDTLTNGALTFTSTNWETAQTVTVTAAQDDDATSDAAVTLTHTANGGDYVDVKETVTVTIVEKDTSVLSVGDARAAEDGGHVVFTVSISAASGATTTVDYATSDVTAAAGQDYTHATGTLTFSPNSVTSRTVSVPITDDTIDEEEEETFTLTLRNAQGASLSGGGPDLSVTGTITDNDAPKGPVDEPIAPQLTLLLSPSTISESGTGNVSTVTASLSSTSTATTTITVSANSASAVTLNGTTLTIAAGLTDSTGTVTITAVDNDVYEVDQEVTVSGSASNDVGVTGPDDVTLTITEDDDRPVTVSFDRATYTVVEGSDVSVTVTLGAPAGRSVTVPIDTTEQNGATTTDYSVVPSSVTFVASETVKSITLTAIDDDVDDDGESVKLTFGDLPLGVSGGATTEAIVTISDNDEPAPIRMPMVTLKVTPSVIEEQGGSRASAAIVTASLDRPSAADTMVTISTDPSAATWFALSENKELTIPAGDSTSTGMVTITAMNGDDFGDYQVLTVEGTARNNGGANGPDPVTLTVFAKDADVIPYPENGTGPVMTFTSTDPENGQPGEGIDWDVTGVDTGDFLIDARGMLLFRRPPDYEDPTDRARSTVDLNGDGDTDDTGEVATIGDDNMYQITVRATEQMTGGPDHRALSAETHVTVMVIDVNESGRLTMNRLQPEVGTPITAMLDDPDGDEDTNGSVGTGEDRVTLGWQWYVSKVEDPVANVEGHWTAATGTGNDTATYTPAGDRVTDTTSTAVDEGRYLRVVVKYLDMGVEDTDDGVTVRMVREEVAVSVNPVREEMSSDLDGVGNTENGSPGFSPAGSYTRTVPENSPVGTLIGDPVVAVDPNDDTLTYELDDDMDADPADRSGDVGHFSIDMATGHITVEKRLDYEDNADGYEFYVRAIDPSGETAKVMVTVIASDANDAPVIMGSRAADATDPTPDAAFELRVNELDDDEEAFDGGPDMPLMGRTGSSLGAKNVFTAMDEDARGQISWEIEGEDVDDFVLSSSGLSGPDEPIELMFRDPPDYEAPTDANRDNVYRVTLVARDSHGAVDSRPLTVFVDNVEEMGKATLLEEQPLIGKSITAAVDDTDRSVAIATWQWMRATSTAANWEVIPGATMATYTPVEADGGHYLRAYATYIDSTSNEDDPATVTADERTQKLDGGNTVAREATMMDGSETDSDRLYRVMVTSDYAVRVDTDTSERGHPPEFAKSTFDRQVVENAEAGTIVGDPVQPVPELDDEGNPKTTFKYDLDATVTYANRYFTIDADSGQIRVGEVDFPNPLPAEVSPVPVGATSPDVDDPVLDYEGANTFTLIVTAEDASDSSRRVMTTVTVSLENLNERPYLDRASRDAVASPRMYGEQRTNAVVQLAAVEPDGHDLRWEVTGADASDFMIVDAEDFNDGRDRVQLMFKSQPDYENGRGSATTTVAGDTYRVTVRATEMNAVGDGPAKGAELPVTVQVTNANEPGMVDFNLLQPEVGTPLTATVSDLDNVDTTQTPTWTWWRAKVSNPNHSPGTDLDELTREWDLIDGADAATYEPQGDDASTADGEDAVDEGRYLMARVEYTDGAGTSTAVGITAHPVRADVSDSANNSPDFDASKITREIPENTAVGMPVGEPVDVASVEDGDVLTYSLDNDADASNGVNMDTDVRFFTIDRSTGQIMVRMPLSAEMTDGRAYTGAGGSVPGRYVFFVRATDPSGETATGEDSDAVEVTVTATDVNETPTVSGPGGAELEVNEADSSDDNYYVGLGNTADVGGAITMNVTTTNLYRGSDEDTFDLLTWPAPIAGPDGALFEYSTHGDGRRLHFISPPDFEDPKDANRDNVYEVTLRVTDKAGAMGQKSVRIAVLNVDEMGTLTLSPEQPRDGKPVIATLTDPDGIVGITDWEWFATSSRSRADAVRVSGATMSEYTSTGRVGQFLWVKAHYRDGASVENYPTTALDERNDNPTTDTGIEQHKFQDRDENGVLDDSDTLFHNSDEGIEEGTEYAVQAAPEPDDRSETPSGGVETFELRVFENTPSTGYVGAPLPDLGPRDEIGGPDGNTFVFAEDMDENGFFYYDSVLAPPVDMEDDKAGQLAAAMVTHFDYEAEKNTYTIEVFDPDSQVDISTYRITIMVMDVNEPPTPPSELRGRPVLNTAPDFGATSTTRMVAEDTDPGTNIGDPVVAMDADRGDQGTLVYTLGGPDAASFTIDSASGQLMTSAALDYDTKSEYMVEVTATDDDDAIATIKVTVMVTGGDLSN